MTGQDHIKRLIRATQSRLEWPAWLKAFGPAMLVLFVYLYAVLLGVHGFLPPKVQAGLTLFVLVVLTGLVLVGIRRFRAPSEHEAIEVIDSLSETRPATTLLDRPVHYNETSLAIWKSHQIRVAKEAFNLPTPSLWRRVQSVDPFFLRFLAPVVLIGASFAAGDLAPQRIAKGLYADIGLLVGADKVQALAWVTPPAYANKAPFNLEASAEARAPEGSELTLRVESPGPPTLKLAYNDDKRQSIQMERGEDGAFEVKLTLEQALDAEIHWWGQRASFSIDTDADLPPIVAFVTPPSRDEVDRTTFEWSASDDHGVQRAELVLKRKTPPNGTENEESIMALDLPGVEPRTIENKFVHDMTRHKWAGLEVEGRLRVTDASGKSTLSEPYNFTLPERLFLQPVAQAAAEIRSVVLREWRDYESLDTITPVELANDNVPSFALPSQLERAPQDIRRSAIMLDALTWQPENYFSDPLLYFGLRRAHETLKTSQTREDANRVDDLLWSVAMRAEFGDFADAARALEAARKALEKALRDGASEDEIKRLMQTYREAVQNYIQQQMAEALRRGQFSNQDQAQNGGQALGDSDLENMLKALEDLAETGATDQARQLLSDMSRMLEQLQNFQFSEGNADGFELPSGPMADALEDLAEALRDQRDLNDDTARSQREQSPGQQGTPSGESSALAERQDALRQRLEDALNGAQSNGQQGGDEEGETGGALSEDGEQAGGQTEGDQRQGSAGGLDGALAEIGEAQRRAAEALREGDLDAARQFQRQAEEALSQAASEMAQLADQASGGPDGDARSAREADQSDPLGRPAGNGAIGSGDEIAVPEQLDRQRARDILEELRRRSAERGLTKEESEYLQRLLDRF